MRRYIDWDFDARIASEYVRHGKCAQCGLCCQTIVKFSQNRDYELLKPLPNDRDIDREQTQVLEANYQVPNIWIDLWVNELRYLHKIFDIGKEPYDCPSFSDDSKLCLSHNDKNPICREWPMSPRHVRAFPQCGYSFELLRAWIF